MQNQIDKDYHGHPNYLLVYLILVAILGISLLAGYLGAKLLAVVLIFGLAVVKAGLVLANFMHVKFEPKIIWGIIGFAVLCMFFFYFGVFPDIVNVPIEIVK